MAGTSFGTGTQPESVALADLNGDGVTDIVTADYMSQVASVLLGNGNGTFQARKSFTTGSGPSSVSDVGKGANFGWPCYEGGNIELSTVGTGNSISQQNPAFASFSRTAPFCRALYNLGLGAVTAPLFSYKHPLDAQGKDLGASVTGVAFYGGTTYPDEYRGALFIANYAQHTIRRLTFNSAGFPTVHPFATETFHTCDQF